MSSSSAGRPVPALLPDALTDLEVAWVEREEEARQLIVSGYNSTAIALRVYALEIRLKTIICRQLNLNCLPRACKTHDLSELVIFTGMWEELQEPKNLAIRQNFDRLVDLSKRWLNDHRYLPRNKLDQSEFQRIADALDHPQDGVLPWLSRRL